MDLAARADEDPLAVPGEEVWLGRFVGPGAHCRSGGCGHRRPGPWAAGDRLAAAQSAAEAPAAASAIPAISAVVTAVETPELAGGTAVGGPAPMAPELVEAHVLRFQLTVELPEVLVVRPPHVVCELVDQGVDQVVVRPEALQAVGAESEHDHLSGVLVVAQKVHIWRAPFRHPLLCLQRAHLCEDAHLKASRLHDIDDAGVGR
mmetsp:Transcript_67990/g.197030  ORF Transcript_67990/g.197030 Transcript_67990/m.197030 type:complete len:204 (-) Transcript_67990:617-1228(-)